MADVAEKPNENGLERGVRLSRDFHIAIGAAALVGAVVFPGVELFALAVEVEAFSVLAHEVVRQMVRTRRA